jgi:hypothetical protein
VYFYTHLLDALAVADLVVPLGVSHASELPLVFNFVLALTHEEAALSRAVLKYWTNFAVNGNPNGDGLPTWPAYGGAGSDAVLMIDAAPAGQDGINATVVTGLKAGVCDWWNTQPDTPKWIIFDNPACNSQL